MNRIVLVGCLALLGLSGGASAVEFNRVLVARSTLTFDYRQMNVPMEGRFRLFTADISFDPAKPDTARARLDISLASIDCGNAEANEEVMGRQWFNAGAFPNAQFVSTGVKALGGNRYELSGQLTLKGRTLDVVMPLTFKQQGALGIFDGAFTLRRLDYAIGEGAWADVSTVANEVRVRFHVVADSATK